MCGFTGYFSPAGTAEVHASKVAACATHIAHRGPDGRKSFSHPLLNTTHLRLAIIDPDERSAQPMTSPCGRYALVYNGEVYNYKALRSQLVQQACRFITESDTEVVLHQLIKHGEAGIAAMNGCFAFAFADLHKQTLLLARDRMGINPLWFTADCEDGLAFSSELKGLPMVGRKKLNPQALRNILEFTYNPEHSSLIEGVHRLPPGCLLHWPSDRTPRQWYSLEATFTAPTSITPLREALEHAVIDRLVADVPVGCFLSGGIDSSLVSAIAARHHSQLNTFSVGFPAHPSADETAAARVVANHIGSTHHCFEMGANDLEAHAMNVINLIDEPFGDSSAIAASFLAEQASLHVKVALSGDGADELLGGYRKHNAHALASAFPKSTSNWAARLLLPLFRPTGRMRAMSKFFEAARLSPEERYLAWARFVPKGVVQQLYPCSDHHGEVIDAIVRGFHERDELNQVLLADQQMVLQGDMLTKVDLTSMRYGLEVRVPFLDHRVVSAANALPALRKYNRKVGKLPLRNEFSDLLPASTFARKKQGFEVPLPWLLRHPLRRSAEDLKHSEHLALAGIERAALHALIDAFMNGQDAAAPALWTLITLDAWLNRHAALIS